MGYPLIKNAVCPAEHKYFTSIYLPESLLYGGEGEVYLVCDYCHRKYTINTSLIQLYKEGKLPKILNKIVLFNNKIFHTRQNLHYKPTLSKYIGPFIETIIDELTDMVYDIFAGKFIRWNRLSSREEVVNRIINHISDIFLNSFEISSVMFKVGQESLIRNHVLTKEYKQKIIDIFSTRQVQEYQYLDYQKAFNLSVPSMQGDLYKLNSRVNIRKDSEENNNDIIRNNISGKPYQYIE